MQQFNSNSFWQDFSGGLHIRLTDSAVSTINGMENRPTKGEFILRQTNDHQFELHRFALMADAGQHGVMSKVARHADVQIVNFEHNPGGFTKIELEIPLNSFVSHSSMDGGFLTNEGTAHIPNHMGFHGQLKISLMQRFRPEKNWRIEGLSFQSECPLDYPDGDSLIQQLKGDWTGQAEVSEINLDHLERAANAEAGAEALGDEPPTSGLWHSIIIRPIWFSSDANPPSDTIKNFIRLQVAQAQELWAKALVRVDVLWQDTNSQTPYQVADDNLAKGTEVTTYLDWAKAIYTWLSNSQNMKPQLGVIDCYFTNFFDSSIQDKINNITDYVKFQGGGITYSGNTAYAKILLSDRRLPGKSDPGKLRWMDYLLAHELGHVLGLGHPYPTGSNPIPIDSDGRFYIPKMTVKAFRLDAANATDGIPNDDNYFNCSQNDEPDPADNLNKVRMRNIICNFKGFWTNGDRDRDFASPRGNNFSSPAGDDSDVILNLVAPKGTGPAFPAKPADPNSSTAYGEALQDCLNNFTAQLTSNEIGNSSDNPVLILFININRATTENPNPIATSIDYHTGMSFVTGINGERFAVPIIVFNKAIGGWQNLFDETRTGPEATAFRFAIYDLLHQPLMHYANYGTVMDSQTPDPAVIDLAICNAVINGVSGGALTITDGKREYVSAVSVMQVNPALRLVPGQSAASPFDDTKSLDMYIPTVKGDAGYGKRNDLGFGIYAKYHSPYFWNSAQDLTKDSESKALLTRVRTEFFDPAAPSIDSYITKTTKALTGVDNYLYIHVRLRANHLPANLPEGVTLEQYLSSAYTRVYVGLRFPGSGGTAENIRPLNEGGKWYCETIAESISADNSSLNFYSSQDERAAVHPYVAGFTVQYPWSLTGDVPEHFCICAFVISKDQPLLNGDGSQVVVDWETVIGNSPNPDRQGEPWGISDLTDVSPDDWFALSDGNPQWMWQNMDRNFVAPGYEGQRLDIAPVGIHVEKSNAVKPEAKSKLIYHIRTETEPIPTNMNVYINRFEKDVESQRVQLNFDESGLAIVPAGETELRSGVYGASFSVDWEKDVSLFSLYFQPYLDDKALDGYNFHIKLRGEETYDFAREIYDTVASALNAFYDHFQINAAQVLLNSLKALSPINIATLTAWPKDAATREKLEKLWFMLGQQAAEDMVVMQGIGEFMESIDGGDDKKMLILMNSVFDHLHFLVILHNGCLASSHSNHNAPPPAK